MEKRFNRLPIEDMFVSSRCVSSNWDWIECLRQRAQFVHLQELKLDI